MKRIIFFILLLFAFYANSYSQDIDSVTLSKLKLNFVVPDMPAFKSLGSDASNLLRPSSVQAIGINMSQFFQEGKFVVPQAFAMEISPALILNAKKGPQQLKKYQQNAVVNSLRISLGTSNNDTTFSVGGRDLAIGARISLIDKGDPVSDITYLQNVDQLLKTIRQNNLEDAKTEFAQTQGLDKNADLDSFINVNLKSFQKFFEANDDIQAPFQKALDKLKDDYKRDHWNDDKLDIAISLLSSSRDSLLKNIVFNKAEFWLTWAKKVGSNSQFLLGVNAQAARNFSTSGKSSDFNFSIPARLLIGTNRVKGFTEAQFTHSGTFNTNELLATLGTELNIIDGVWVNIDAGLNYDTDAGKSSFATTFNLKLTLPENFKLF